MNIDWKNISKYSLIPIEYRFIDQCNVLPGKEAVGTKMVSSQDWFFKFHFPGNPIMPGVFLMEVMQQTGYLIITTMEDNEPNTLFMQSCKSMRIYKPVRPGDEIKAYVSLISYRLGIANFHGEVKKVEGTEESLVCKMDFTLVSESSLVKVSAGGVIIIFVIKMKVKLLRSIGQTLVGF